ncbi:hypothetical protein [Butyrivibrio sp. AE2015]|uniref:hypothetical protein n=1 Tax=Butyrivibrio sp. AE2015 TaxID=1280663 RepID=UPI0003B72CEA|nr:hypothetical protein [Butyrivibrio sp. AE2015]
MKEDYLKKAREENWKICTYGLGYLGKRLRHIIPELFGLKPDFYCDSNDIKVKEAGFEDADPIYRNELKMIKEPIIVFILTDDPYDIEIQNDLSTNKSLFTYTLRELALMDQVIHVFYGDELFEMYKRL